MDFTENFCGITYYAQDNGWLSLPLEEVRVRVSIVDVSARVVLTQAFYNHRPTAINKAKYVFPVPARSAVCAFELDLGEESHIVGIVREKSKAAEDYEAAVREGKFTGLVEWVSDDTFTLSIGDLPPMKTVTARITFVMDLMDDETVDQVRFQLPVFLAQRYGEEPAGLAGAIRAPASSRVKIEASIQMAGKITNVASPTHDVAFSPFVTLSGIQSRRRMTAEYRSRTLLESDFVLVVQAEGLDEPRCFAERSPSGNTVALQLSLVPKFDRLRPISQEFLFLVDTSGSMHSGALDTVKETIHLLLRWLPNHETTFNLSGFNHTVSYLWSSSVKYNQATMQSALNFVNGFQADGSTDIGKALTHAFRGRQMSKPTVVFVLTDGGDTEIEETISIVSAAVSNSTPKYPLRVFTLGIGQAVSTAMCEGIARAGGGEAFFATTAEEIMGKCNKLLRAGRTLGVEDVEIDWGFVPTQAPLGGSLTPSPVQAPPSGLDVLRQSPRDVKRLYPGLRTTIFAILPQRSVPEQIVLRGHYSGDQEMFQLAVQVQSVDTRNVNSTLIHTLAARRIITDLESDRQITSTLASPEYIHKNEMVRLGIKYQLATRFTSFVAVENIPNNSLSRDPKEGPLAPGTTRSVLRNGTVAPASRLGNLGLEDYVHTGVGVVLKFLSKGMGYFQRVGDTPRMGGGVSGSYESDHGEDEAGDDSDTQDGEESDFDFHVDYDDDDDGYASGDSFSTLSSFFSSYSDDPNCSQCHGVPPAPRARVKIDLGDSDGDPTPTCHGLVHAAHAPPEMRGQLQSSLASLPPPPPPVPHEIFQLSKLQQFDGSFPLDNKAFAQVVGKRALDEKVDVDARVWATAVAVAFIQKHLVGHPEILDNVLAKTMEFVYGELGSRERTTFKKLVDRAALLVV